ncbi:nucleotide exchange factor GrpE [Methylomonas sp. EFPC3]|uniref:nucleotide exchange factor GrpE n=1 Tax=Methylomonas TaxID=416 RepID=UPI001127AEB0|nr:MULTISPECIES: nucleotide exchange factor GrpE [Methylomonas]TPQ25419.1 nucleotide exchange factor GrpE [Methylomonas koyamae]WFP51767.1 nucleotide exchange factor GrpE [Methylomonas sp. EFPC3]
MSHQQSSHEQQPDSELIAEVLEQTKPAFEEAAAEETAGEETVGIESLRQQLEQAQQQAAANLDKALRTQAEMENLKKRVQKDLDDERKYGLAKFAKELLSVLDSLELGIQAASGDSPEVVKLREGSLLTVKQFESVFAKFNIETIDPLGQPFNPEFHQAMVMQPSETAEPNSVLNVFQKGYVLNGRLLRPAMVVVAKAADKPADSAKIDEQA